jgi:hypothetical protein
MKDWVRPIGLAYRHGEPTQLFECLACGKQVEFAIEPQAQSVRRVGGTMQPPLAQPSAEAGPSGISDSGARAHKIHSGGDLRRKMMPAPTTVTATTAMMIQKTSWLA